MTYISRIPSTLICILLMLCIALPLSVYGIVIATSYFTLIKRADDILIIKIARIEGEHFGEKAIAGVERSLKGNVRQDSIELPFIYESWPTGGGGMTWVEDVVPVSFEVGRRYLVLLQKPRRNGGRIGNPYTPKTEYEVLQYPKNTYFELTPDRDIKLWEIEHLLEIGNQRDTLKKVNSLLSLLGRDNSEIRVDAVEALVDLKSKDVAGPFVSTLLHDPDASVRHSAAVGLAYLDSGTTIDDALMESARSESAKLVRSQSIYSLGIRRARKSIPFLLGLFEMSQAEIRSAILTSISRMPDSSEIPSLIRMYSLDHDYQDRHSIVEIVASINTLRAHDFASSLLDTSPSYWIKGAVMKGWADADYKDGFERIARWTSIPCPSGNKPSKEGAELQSMVLPLLGAVGRLGRPDQVLMSLKGYASCDDKAIRQDAVRILREQVNKDISPRLRDELLKAIDAFHSN